MFPSPAQLGVRFAPGTMLGRYELLATIGVGGMASVILARQRGPAGFEKAVVIKLIHPHMAQDHVAVNMLLDEAKVAAQLDHQNIVHTYELGEAQGTYYIVMEYLAGESLGQVMKQGNKIGIDIPPFVAAKIVSDAADGLHYAHELTDFEGHALGIVHRDVSPGNIVVQYNGSVKVVDFGIAKAQGRVTSTQDGELKGKYGYMSPEQIKNDTMDRRSDVFSLGVVLWEALARQRLFQADNVAATLMQILQGDRTPPSAFDPEIPHALDAVTLRALAPDPADRFQTVAEMKQAIDDAIWRARIGAAEVAQHMTALFSERIEMRRTLLARATREMMSVGDLEALGTAFRDPSSAVSRPGSLSGPGAPLARGEDYPSVSQTLDRSVSHSHSHSQPSERSADALPPPPPGPAPRLSWSQTPSAPMPMPPTPMPMPPITVAPNLPPPTIQRASWFPPSETGPAPAYMRPSVPHLDAEKPERKPRVLGILVGGAAVGIAFGLLYGLAGRSKDKAPEAQVEPTVAMTEEPGSAAKPSVAAAMASAESTPAPAETQATVRPPTVAKVNPPAPPAPPPAPPEPESSVPEKSVPVETMVRPSPIAKPPAERVKPPSEPRPERTERTERVRTEPKPKPEDSDDKPKAPTGTAQELYDKGTQAFLAGDFATAEAAYKGAAARGNSAGYRGLGFLYQRTGDATKALQALRTYLKTTPNAKDGASIRRRIQQLGGD